MPIPNKPELLYVCTAGAAVAVVVLVLDSVIVVSDAAPAAAAVTPGGGALGRDVSIGAPGAGGYAAPYPPAAGAAATVTPVCTASAAGMEDRPGVIAPETVVMMEAAPSGTGWEVTDAAAAAAETAGMVMEEV